MRVRPAVHSDGAFVRRRDLEEREDGRHAVCRRRLVAAFCAVTDEDRGRLGCRRREFDQAALAVSFHFLFSDSRILNVLGISVVESSLGLGAVLGFGRMNGRCWC